jgi:Na+/H+ antiporter NhaC
MYLERRIRWCFIKVIKQKDGGLKYLISNVNNKLKRNTLLPCSMMNTLGACNQELPERWWKAT